MAFLGDNRPDPDARIGYCAAKKRAFVGYRVTAICSAMEMLVLDYRTTPANVHDASALPPLLDDMEENGLLNQVKEMYGDNAYNTTENDLALKKDGRSIGNRIHTKAETGKHPQDPKSAKAKSKVRSKVECLYGILSENYAWGQLHVRTMPRVRIAIGSAFIAWNFFFLMAYLLGEPEHCRSLRQFLHNNGFKEE